MKLICKLELLQEYKLSFVTVYKLEQCEYRKKNVDIRNVTEKIFSQLFVYINNLVKIG